MQPRNSSASRHSSAESPETFSVHAARLARVHRAAVADLGLTPEDDTPGGASRNRTVSLSYGRPFCQGDNPTKQGPAGESLITATLPSGA